MELNVKQILGFVLVQVLVLVALFVGQMRRGRRERPLEMAPGTAPTRDSHAWSPQALLWPVAIAAVFVVGKQLWGPVSLWYASRNPPATEHRDALIETASKQLRCPAEQLIVEPPTTESLQEGSAKVKGCGGSTKLCWGRSGRYVPSRWMDCYLLFN